MNEIIGYLRNYIQSVNRSVFLFTTFFIAIAITCNYTLGVNAAIVSIHSWVLRTTGFFLLFAFIFSAAWLLQFISTGKGIIENRFFFVLLLVAPVIFAVKVT